MKYRKPVLVCFFSFLSGGIYFFYWLFSLIEEINAYQQKEVINYKKTVIKFCSILGVYLILFGVLFSTILEVAALDFLYVIVFVLCFGLVIYWFVLILKTISNIAHEIQKIQIDNNIASPIDPKLALLLFILYFFALFYLQEHINKIISLNGEEKVNIKKSLTVSLIMGIVVFLFVSIVGGGMLMKSGVFSGKEPIFVTDIALSEKTEEKIFIDEEKLYAIWVNCNFEYHAGFSPLITITIRNDDKTILKEEYNPLNAGVRMNSVSTSANGRTKVRFRGRLDRIHLEAGSYTLILERTLDDNLIQLNEYQVYVR